MLRPGYVARPFICTGSPFGCQVALIGANPGTATSFWDAWSHETGFNKEAWLAAFNRDPANRRKKSRHRIDALVSALSPVRCIELNAYPYFAPRADKLTPDLCDTSVLEYLLSCIKPPVLLASGRVAVLELGRLAGTPVVQNGKFNPISVAGYQARILADEHFLMWKQTNIEAKIAELARLIRSQVQLDASQETASK